MLSFRRATLADRPAMLEICAGVWEGEDYLPDVFDEWVAEPGGQFTAAEIDEKVVALARLAKLAPGEYWLEGIRVHADYRGQGLAAALHNHHLDLWRKWGEPGTLRLATDSENLPIIKLCERTGFTRLFEFAFAEAEAQAGSHRFSLVKPSEAERAFERLTQLPWYAELYGLCDLGWKWRALTPAYLTERIAAGAVWRWGAWEGLLLTSTESIEAKGLWLQFPGAPPDQRVPFFVEARTLAHALGGSHVRWSAPVRPDILAELPTAGYVRMWESSVEYCFEIRQ
jgi:GNAT superfamily N-acetyltransferase